MEEHLKIKMNNEEREKNILDLRYQKHLQYFAITIIILCTYVIGVIIAIVTKQISFDFIGIVSLAVISAIIGTPLTLLLRFNKRKINRILIAVEYIGKKPPL